VKRDADDRDMIDPLFIMKNVKLKLYCAAAKLNNFSDHRRPICRL
jgi:hypothetical protein